MSDQQRRNILRALTKTQYDIVIIGGGITGAGIALDAISRGLRVALVEKGDYASGTSSKSTKLIHGGLRYLKQMELGLVRESGVERAVVHELAPHLCLPEKMLLPLIPNGSLGKWSTSLALRVYDFLAGVEKEDRRDMLSPTEAIQKEPLLEGQNLIGAGYYAEYRTDDARLTIELIKKARSLGAVCINYVEARKFIRTEDKISGLKCKDKLTGDQVKIKSSLVVSAAGPWVDHLRKKNKSIGKKHLFHSKGVHIVFPRKRLPIQQSIYFDVPDGRMIFAIPRGEVTYLGTTDTPYNGDLDRIVSTEADRDYLLRAVNHMFPTLSLTRYDVISSWAGIRPLIYESGKSASEISRKDEIFESKDGLISIAGGKLTGYRKMAQRVVDRAMTRLCQRYDYQKSDSKTRDLRLTSDPFQSAGEVDLYIDQLIQTYVSKGVTASRIRYLVYNYGKDAKWILDASQLDELSIVLSELSYCVDQEQIERVADFLVRRTGRLYFDPLYVPEILDAVITKLGDLKGWTSDRVQEEQVEMIQLIDDSKTFYAEEVSVSI